ncbi:pro-resilin-like [Coccinella septempunctata]|uniref:pro-resilin-like n=1 Tax=Coccinella septempunctata TaxID=41139 RepID=UPI001D08FD0F|nr:pro-resilin-like [Coccinella septempunctata]
MDRKIITKIIFFTFICNGFCGIANDQTAQANAPLNSYGTPNYDANDYDNHHENGKPKAYEFGYQVKDDYSGNDYNRQEVSDGNQVRGEYRVALPDGRTQIVTYWADWQSGFHADVRYEGEARYPDQYNNNNNQGYNYQNGYNQQQNAYPAPAGINNDAYNINNDYSGSQDGGYNNGYNGYSQKPRYRNGYGS